MLPRPRAVMLTGYLEVARFVGLDPYKMLARAGLSAAALQDPENWLPGSRVLEGAECFGDESPGKSHGVLR